MVRARRQKVRICVRTAISVYRGGYLTLSTKPYVAVRSKQPFESPTGL